MLACDGAAPLKPILLDLVMVPLLHACMTLHLFVTTPGDCASSPEAVQVRVGKPLRTCPRGSTAPAFHGVPARRLQFYERLEVAHPSGGVRFAFSTRERSHCALVYYEDVACPGAEARELAYADLLYCYTIKGRTSESLGQGLLKEWV